MSDYEEEVVEAKLVDRFMQLGLTEYEAYTLVALMRLGTGTAKDVADFNHVPRTRVYDAAETLHELGLVDIQHMTPRKFTVISQDSIIRKLNARRQNTIREAAELGEQLTRREPTTEELGAWTVNGHAPVAQRASEFIDEAEDESERRVANPRENTGGTLHHHEIGRSTDFFVRSFELHSWPVN